MTAENADTSREAVPAQPNETESGGSSVASTQERRIRRYTRPREDRARGSDFARDRPDDGRRLRIMVLDPDGSKAGYSHDLCNSLAERGSDVHLLTSPSGWASSAGCGSRHYTSRVGFPGGTGSRGRGGLAATPPAGPLGWLERVAALFRLIPRTRRFDVVHCHGIHWGLAEVLWLWLVSRWTRVALTVHEVIPRSGGRGPWTRWLHKRAYRAADILFAHAGSTEAELVEEFDVPRGRIVRIHHGSSTHVTGRMSRSPSCPLAEADTPVVLFMGDLREHKGVDLLLKAANHLRREVWNFRVVIAGEPAMEMRGLHDLVRDLGLERLVEFRLGTIPPEELQAYFSRASVIALPYREVDQCPVAIHACTFGRPVVACRVGGLAEMVDEADNGLLVPPDDPQAFASALAELLRDDRLQKRFGSNSLIYAKTDLSWRRIAGESAAAYRRVVRA